MKSGDEPSSSTYVARARRNICHHIAVAAGLAEVSCVTNRLTLRRHGSVETLSNKLSDRLFGMIRFFKSLSPFSSPRFKIRARSFCER